MVFFFSVDAIGAVSASYDYRDCIPRMETAQARWDGSDFGDSGRSGCVSPSHVPPAVRYLNLSKE
jgi:hypothetical protein